MKTLKDHNDQYLKDHKFPTGLKCPVCKEEMFFLKSYRNNFTRPLYNNALLYFSARNSGIE